VQEWLNYIASELHKGFSPLFTRDAGRLQNDRESQSCEQFAYLDKMLADKDYLTGKISPSQMPICSRSELAAQTQYRHFRYKNLSAYLDRVAHRPKVKEAMQSEGLLKGRENVLRACQR